MSQVRPCTKGDIGRALTLARSFHEESPHHREFAFDAVRVAALIEMAVDRHDFLALVVDDADGALSAFCMFHAAPMFFSSEIEVSDVVFYTRPDRRGMIHAARMLDAAMMFADNVGASRMVMSIFNGIDDDRAARFFEGHGFKRAGIVLHI